MKLKNIYLGAMVTAFLLVSVTAVQANSNYIVDPDYSRIMFRIKHLMGYSTGVFAEFSGTLQLDKKEQLSALESTIDVASLETHNDMRDEELRSEKFFYVEKFPSASFKMKKIEDGHIVADLTLHGVTKEVSFDYHLWGTGKDQFGRRKVALSLTGMINRREFGIEFNAKTDDDKWLLGDEVDLMVEVQGILKEDMKIKRKKF